MEFGFSELNRYEQIRKEHRPTFPSFVGMLDHHLKSAQKLTEGNEKAVDVCFEEIISAFEPIFREEKKIQRYRSLKLNERDYKRTVHVVNCLLKGTPLPYKLKTADQKRFATELLKNIDRIIPAERFAIRNFPPTYLWIPAAESTLSSLETLFDPYTSAQNFHPNSNPRFSHELESNAVFTANGTYFQLKLGKSYVTLRGVMACKVNGGRSYDDRLDVVCQVREGSLESVLHYDLSTSPALSGLRNEAMLSETGYFFRSCEAQKRVEIKKISGQRHFVIKHQVNQETTLNFVDEEKLCENDRLYKRWMNHPITLGGEVFLYVLERVKTEFNTLQKIYTNTRQTTPCAK